MSLEAPSASMSFPLLALPDDILYMIVCMLADNHELPSDIAARNPISDKNKNENVLENTPPQEPQILNLQPLLSLSATCSRLRMLSRGIISREFHIGRSGGGGGGDDDKVDFLSPLNWLIDASSLANVHVRTLGLHNWWPATTTTTPSETPKLHLESTAKLFSTLPNLSSLRTLRLRKSLDFLGQHIPPHFLLPQVQTLELVPPKPLQNPSDSQRGGAEWILPSLPNLSQIRLDGYHDEDLALSFTDKPHSDWLRKAVSASSNVSGLRRFELLGHWDEETLEKVVTAMPGLRELELDGCEPLSWLSGSALLRRLGRLERLDLAKRNMLFMDGSWLKKGGVYRAMRSGVGRGDAEGFVGKVFSELPGLKTLVVKGVMRADVCDVVMKDGAAAGETDAKIRVGLSVGREVVRFDVGVKRESSQGWSHG